MRTEFGGKIIIIGFGSVGQAVITLLLKHITISPDRILVISASSIGQNIANELKIPFLLNPLTESNYKEVLVPYLQAGDFVLNLSVNVSSIALMKLCHEANALYLDTCTEPWEGKYTDRDLPPEQRTNYYFRKMTLALRTTHTDNLGPTALITHGANPGLVSHFVKEALLTIANDHTKGYEVPKTRGEWASLAQTLNIKVIHIAERDTQKTNKQKQPNEFCNTWSVDGLHSEACQPAELGWGTHETELPQGAQFCEENSSSIFLAQPGYSTKVQTYTPYSGVTIGNLVTHAESISIAEYLSVYDEAGTVVYRPTVHYAYRPCDDAVTSLDELKTQDGHLHEKQRVMVDEIESGHDELGVLLMGHRGNAYWYGSKVDIEEARNLALYNNATSIQVAAGVLAGVTWIIKNPKLGIIEPDEMNHKEVLEIALPYLGKVFGEYTNWKPNQNSPVTIARKKSTWQFDDFIV